MTPLLELDGVSWHAGAAAVIERVSFCLDAGEFAAILGRNGAGKSTLLDIIAGLRQPTAGRAALAGRPLAALTALERARSLAHLPQAVGGDLRTTAEALVLMGRYAGADRWFESDHDRDVAEAAMARCGCLEFRDRSMATLSGGERQRVLLAACLAQRPRVLLLDEPSTFLDVDQQVHCFEILRETVDAGAACLAVTHDINLALRFCTRVLILSGHTVACDLTRAAALADSAWLRQLSSRLTMDPGPADTWVRYR